MIFVIHYLESKTFAELVVAGGMVRCENLISRKSQIIKAPGCFKGKVVPELLTQHHDMKTY